MNEPGMPGGGFHTTRWSRVSAARGKSEEAGEALRDLCADYYGPVVAFLVRDGRTGEAAREVAHDFFAELLAGGALAGADRGKGRFRSYLLGALRHHLSRRRERDERWKRGGGAMHVPLVDEHSPTSAGSDGGAWRGSDAVAVDERLTPDEAFDRQWALTVVVRALRALEDEASARGAGDEFRRLRPWLTGEAAHGDQRAAAEALGRSTNAFKVAVHRLRRAFRQRVREEVERTLADPDAADEEIRALFSALG